MQSNALCGFDGISRWIHIKILTFWAVLCNLSENFTAELAMMVFFLRNTENSADRCSPFPETTAQAFCDFTENLIQDVKLNYIISVF